MRVGTWEIVEVADELAGLGSHFGTNAPDGLTKATVAFVVCAFHHGERAFGYARDTLIRGSRKRTGCCFLLFPEQQKHNLCCLGWE